MACVTGARQGDRARGNVLSECDCRAAAPLRGLAGIGDGDVAD
jgi:hypothetical protein